ncbi:hypothetical protein HAX54_049925 [Datura stramonium]|uniref:Uncharacterized protein n=1 Tax=Datura stramonium TaxID=4076 RepID=A0ABS8RQU6_DATST|nr:hypothetical protein [Datura stramonium]
MDDDNEQTLRATVSTTSTSAASSSSILTRFAAPNARFAVEIFDVAECACAWSLRANREEFDAYRKKPQGSSLGRG